ncbi:beta-mannosidase-like [Littorina saxatilis]|uniref:beta-mannosidase n=1 Tax=Littorina saxatilis TaxID=31220 RepID=A0AAN9BPP7_9CAEN
MCLLWNVGVLSGLLVVVIVNTSDAGIVQQDLTGMWTVSSDARGISVPGQVPGSMYTALYYNNVTEDPLYRDNDVKLAWVGRENWTYSRTFEVSNDMVQSQSILLVAEGIDTVSTLFINGQQVATTNNMFLKYAFDVKRFVKPGNNSIRFSFQSAVDYSRKQAANYPYDVPTDCPPAVQNGECHINFIRKEPCSFSWNWGPSFPTQGIWKPIYLEGFSSAILDMATVEVMPGATGTDLFLQGPRSWLLRTKAYFNIGGDRSVSGQLQIALAKTGISETHTLTLSADRNWVEFDIVVPQSANVKRWWPNGYGDQPLYDVIFTFTSNDGDVTTLTRRVGFRTVELVEDPVSADPEQGLTFYFRVNGLPVFMKGANWVPADSFQERITRDSLRAILTHATDAHMNCFRVWGGGVYESEAFYDLADELGILIYQDFMFSDSHYPSDPEFLDNVHREVTYQVRQLMHRPSLLIWSGSNENEKHLREPKWNMQNFTLYYEDYIKLYIDTVRAAVWSENPSRVYLVSSPSNGREEAMEGYAANNSESEFFGDVHFYIEYGNVWIPETFPIPRMASEYGIIAWCNYDTLVGAFEATDMAFNSSVALGRQHYGYGNFAMINQTTYHLDLPPRSRPEPQRFRDFIYISQINQAMAHKTQTEHYRRQQSAVRHDGRGLTMGAIYWMLKDIWQAPSRASLDYSGRWKMMHYYAARFFAPLLVSPYMDGSDVNIFVVVDQIPTMDVRDPDTQRLRFEPLTDLKVIMKDTADKDTVLDLISKGERATSGMLTVEMYSWHSFTPLRQWTVPYKLNTTAESVFRQDVDSMMTEAGCTSSTECFIYTFLGDPDDGINNWIYLAELKDSNLPSTTVTITTVSQISPREFTITLTTDAIAPFVWLEAGSMMGRFSDNGFLLVKMTFTVTFTAWRDDVDSHTLRSQLSVLSLMDVY